MHHSANDYPLSRGQQQQIRVNLLQSIWRDTNGYLLHPAIQELKENATVADVATATGLWLCSLNLEHPDRFDLYGFDVSSESFLPTIDLPKNVRVAVVDASKPPPEKYKGFFEVVHVRLLQAMIQKNDPEWVISHCLELLRPGGYLQWEEFDPMAVTVYDSGDGASGLQGLLVKLKAIKDSTWIQDLPNRMTNMGLEIKEVDRRRQVSFHSRSLTYLHCSVFEEIANVQFERYGPADSIEELRELIKDGYSESARGSSVQYLLQTVVAQKPKRT